MIEISSVNDLILISQEVPSRDHVGGWFYRGQSDKVWLAVPKAFRSPYSEGMSFDHKFCMWRKYAFSHPILENTF